MTLPEFVTAVILYAWITDCSVTSWGRTRAHNRKVGGVPRSAHQVWLAVDVIYDDLRPPEEGEHIATNLGLRLIRESDHDHLQPLDWKA